MPKQIAVVALDHNAAVFYAGQLQELFGSLVTASPYSVRDGSVRKLGRADLYVVSTDAFESDSDFREYIPIDRETVEIGVTFRKETLTRLGRIPKDSRALFVNLSEKMCREAMTQLNQLGVNHIRFTPFYPGARPVEGFALAVTPAETRYVPAGISQVVDIGQRVLDVDTVMEAALKLRLDYLLESDGVKAYFQSVAAGSYSLDVLFGRSLRLESRFEILLDILDEGIIGVNEENRVFACNRKAADITGVNRRLAPDRPAAEIFPYLPFASCRDTGAAVDPGLLTIRGVAVNVSVVPVVRGGEYMGAFATLQRFNDAETKQNRLRIQLLNKGHQAKYTFDDIIGDSAVLRKAVDISQRMARTNSAVLITGESGTGKELFAHAIHNASSRRDYPFIAINCAAMPDNLLESELFGYEEGAFTGARKGGKPGLFEFAHKGTIFLDEVEGMSAALQVKLLRVIQEREVMRVGGNKIISIDVRIVAATNERLEALMAAGSFRKDLYYRLNTLPVQIPALRDRPDDILPLLEHFRQDLEGDFVLTGDAREALLRHPWDGNIRELRNVAEYFTYTGIREITSADLPPGFYPAPPACFRKIEADRQTFLRVAGTRRREYCFVLECLQLGEQENRTVGRDAILQQAAARGLPLSQHEARMILGNLESLRLVKISKGRGGSRLTEMGRELASSALELV